MPTTGTWKITPVFVSRVGDCWGVVMPGMSTSGTITYAIPAEPYIYLDGSTTPIMGADLPAGFVVDDTFVWRAQGEITISAPSSGSLAYAIPWLSVSAAYGSGTVIDDNPGGNGYLTGTGLTMLDFLAGAGELATVNGTAINNEAFGYNPALTATVEEITGTYTILSTWWTLGESCAHPSALRYGASPGLPYTPYDPDDPTAHPTPAIATVTPSHGPIAGGTSITLRGSGFGVDATVDIDGTPATDVDVVNADTITCTTPAHATGSVTVVVTNPDGVSS